MTAEEIAREAAEALVTVRTGAAAFGPHGESVFIGAEDAYHYRDPGDAGRDADKFRGQIAAAVLAAVERALREVPVPGALGAERLDVIRGRLEAAAALPEESRWHRGQVLRALDAVREVLADNDHLRRALHDCGQDGTAEVWAGGFEAGKRAAVEELKREWLAGFGAGATVQKSIDVGAAQGLADATEPEIGNKRAMAQYVAAVVRRAPQATPALPAMREA